jgi:hypothetical protein
MVLGVNNLNPMKQQWRVDEFQAALNKNIALFAVLPFDMWSAVNLL